mmetsp:Transcript_398/g.675  ORF Transcript_398/g.675 Transcript_398/m.675 type:complete len:101 (-) Transcript_398:1083-1385(-)
MGMTRSKTSSRMQLRRVLRVRSLGMPQFSELLFFPCRDLRENSDKTSWNNRGGAMDLAARGSLLIFDVPPVLNKRDHKRENEKDSDNFDGLSATLFGVLL